MEIFEKPEFERRRDRKGTKAEDFQGDEPSDANCQTLLDGEDLKRAKKGSQKKISGGTGLLDTVKPGREDNGPNGTGEGSR